MGMDNTVTIAGNLTREVELRFTDKGTPVATAGIAVNNRYQQNGDWKEQTSFFNVVVWGTQGEHLAESASKGDRVLVHGEVRQRSWETADGEKRSTVEIKALEVAVSLRFGVVTGFQKDSAEGRVPAPEDHGVTEASAAEESEAKEPAMAGAPAADEDPFE